VAANPIQMAGLHPVEPGVPDKAAESERFLFYRGLGNFTLPVEVRGTDGGVSLSNPSSSAVGTVFVLRVDAKNGDFAVHPEGIAPGGHLSEAFLDKTGQPLDAYVDSLATAMTRELDKTGLYHDEALAMVNTWKRQWFRTPGLRVLYLAPQAWTDAQIPLAVEPTPVETKRVMVIRVEAITPLEEEGDVQTVARFDTDEAAGEAHFVALGRFAEPRLRRALQIAAQQGPADGQKRAGEFLVQIAGANTQAGIGE
jgi:hypothetical protein